MNYSLYLIDDRLVIDLGAGEKSQHKAFSGVPELVETHTFYQEPIGQVEISDEQLAKIELDFHNGGLCDYCDELSKKVRPSPFMGDVGSSMCKDCWDMTKKEYAASHDEHIGDFEDYPHWKGNTDETKQ
ncbi:hypothetical protein G3M80_13910 [Bacillus altitudinis]|uniref:hypothetical protein n=1 Tax=Bacillus altitudinis TaxID=293387 RepID=UPI0013EEDBB5|nr:hypothetical protein [Bacillus altitudinis]QII25645.1 hypothetical protein G3M80_13910 [Bacillus altitudinis]